MGKKIIKVTAGKLYGEKYVKEKRASFHYLILEVSGSSIADLFIHVIIVVTCEVTETTRGVSL